MAPTQSFQSSWKAYQEAVDTLYTGPTSEQVEGSIGATTPVGAEGRNNILVICAQDVRRVLVSGLQVEDVSQRELAGLKLLAAAASDLAVASDLLEWDAAGTTRRVVRSTHGLLLASPELQRVLNTPLEEGMQGLQRITRAAVFNDPQSARAQLELMVETFLHDIPDATAAVSQKAVNHVLGLPVLQTLLPNLQEIARILPASLSAVSASAAKLVIEAVTKLWTAIGKDEQNTALAQVTEWLKAIEGHAAIAILNTLYETERLGEEVRVLIAASSATTEAIRYTKAIQTLQGLSSGFNTTKGVLTRILQVLDWVKAPLLLIPPWGPLALYTTYLGVLGYAIYSGGDYLDWYRLGDIVWLHRVQGLRTAVRQAINTAE